MLIHRLLVGSATVIILSSLVYIDQFTAPYHPILLLVVLGFAAVSTHELTYLFVTEYRPNWHIAYACIFVILLANWFSIHVNNYHTLQSEMRAWMIIICSFVLITLITCIYILSDYDPKRRSTIRLSLYLLSFFYLGICPGFLIRLVWLSPEHYLNLIIAAIAVPKVGDIGAYTVGRLCGKSPLAPILSPKKTREGLFGGICAAVLTAIAISLLTTIFQYGLWEAVAFGVIVGTVGATGDLVESMFKRDGEVKDASKRIPGYGGVLDMIDSILFASPVVYLWFFISLATG
jgi:phosphatidate cytidylyltransferase